MKNPSTKLFSKPVIPLSFSGDQRNYSNINLPEWYPVMKDVLQTIQPCKNAIVRLPSENFKVVDLKPNSYLFSRGRSLLSRSISLGKFGTFNANQLFGKPYGPSWEILPNKDIKLLEREVQEEEGKIPPETEVTGPR